MAQAVISLARTQITNTKMTVFHLCDGIFPSQPFYVYLFGPKSDFFREYIDTHYKMTRILFVFLFICATNIDLQIHK